MTASWGTLKAVLGHRRTAQEVIRRGSETTLGHFEAVATAPHHPEQPVEESKVGIRDLGVLPKRAKMRPPFHHTQMNIGPQRESATFTLWLRG